jgi:putative oxidoreductase
MATAHPHSFHRPFASHAQRSLIDRIASEGGNIIWLVGRILIGGIFVQSGFAKLINLSAFAAMLSAQGTPDGTAASLAPIAAAVEFGGGLLIVVGLATRYAALLMIAFVIAATLVSHRFWDFEGPMRQMQIINFEKNLAIVGGFLFVFVTGGGRYGIDRWWQRDMRPPASLNLS